VTNSANRRICYLASDPRMQLAAPTGYGSHIRKTIAALEHQQFDVLKVIAGDRRDITKSRNLYRKFGRPKSRLVQWLKSAARDAHEVFDDYLSGARYKRLIRAAPCDFLYERMAPFRSVGLTLAKHFEMPWVLEVNDPMEETLRFYPSSLKWYALRTEKRMIRQATGIVVGSERLKAYYLERGLTDSQVKVVYPTADYDLFKCSDSSESTEPGRRNKAVRFGFVGTMNPWHRVDLLIQAFERIARSREVELILIGEGTESGRLKEMVQALKLEGKVHFLGSVAYEEVPALISGIDVCVIPNATWYGSPTKLFEYGAMGKAVIGPRDTPVDEIIQDGETGILIKPGDLPGLIEALECLSRDRETRLALGTRLHEKLTREITWPRNVETILTVAGSRQRARAIEAEPGPANAAP
jgi:glycosyltransferase involved in cell wall biosynthesis